MNNKLILIPLLALFIIPFCSAPLVIWHFDEVTDKINLTYEGKEDVKFFSDNAITGGAVGVNFKSFFGVLTPLLIVPFVVFVLLFFSRFEGKIEDKSKEDIDDETDETVVSRFVVDSLLNGAEEDEIRKELDMHGYDEAIVNKIFDELESEV
jgi:hypothetical protein